MQQHFRSKLIAPGMTRRRHTSGTTAPPGLSARRAWMRRCPHGREEGECGGPLEALLTIDSSEWDGNSGSWRPAETASKLVGDPYRSLRNPTMMTIGRGYTLQVYSCVSTPSHLPRTIMQ
ncbi:hypothetical protein [Streptomyces sp. CL12-4]|uniref:hypothetical protein n=1 Tax=Streptomyces sp. CL12-4 TaxID=2810306 RepID=UPI001EFA6BD7|nr:hypothetical protein [Streptomyces sp. CL12-4]MCG8969092.1 hypothetical protein [Streptomyces sp. CL12-4]